MDDEPQPEGVLKVAVVGLASATHDEAPWDDPSWEKWGLPWDAGYWARCSRLFEMHDLRLLESEASKRGAHYLDLLRGVWVPLYMQESYESIPSAQRYPFEDVARTLGKPYWNSSIAYAMALAIHEGASEIGVYGVQMDATDEYSYQRYNMEWLIGLAEGRGIKVHIPDQSPLCKFNHAGIRFFDSEPEYKDRYGWLG